MSILDLHLEQFVGKELETTGFVFREQDFEDNQLVVARFSMHLVRLRMLKYTEYY
ncbi:hypothetical protein KHA80_02140 [Anaerobacillus sp. HL2]|nr:hypothetical protein KHA80_02140 [Anaerobacillus sp. HL2]